MLHPNFEMQMSSASKHNAKILTRKALWSCNSLAYGWAKVGVAKLHSQPAHLGDGLAKCASWETRSPMLQVLFSM